MNHSHPLFHIFSRILVIFVVSSCERLRCQPDAVQSTSCATYYTIGCIDCRELRPARVLSIAELHCSGFAAQRALRGLLSEMV